MGENRIGWLPAPQKDKYQVNGCLPMENVLKAMALLIIISFAIGAYAYPHLPESAASHWNAESTDVRPPGTPA